MKPRRPRNVADFVHPMTDDFTIESYSQKVYFPGHAGNPNGGWGFISLPRVRFLEKPLEDE